MGETKWCGEEGGRWRRRTRGGQSGVRKRERGREVGEGGKERE